jgi:hypothetical protein
MRNRENVIDLKEIIGAPGTIRTSDPQIRSSSYACIRSYPFVRQSAPEVNHYAVLIALFAPSAILS